MQGCSNSSLIYTHRDHPLWPSKYNEACQSYEVCSANVDINDCGPMDTWCPAFLTNITDGSTDGSADGSARTNDGRPRNLGPIRGLKKKLHGEGTDKQTDSTAL